MKDKIQEDFVKIVSVSKGYFLTIGDESNIENTWAVTKGEMKTLQKMLNQMLPEEKK